MTISTVLLDLDGVIRHFDPAPIAAIEERFGLAEGALMRAAFQPELLTPAITGKVSRHEWADNVGQILDCPEAAAEWLAYRGGIDGAMITLIDELRARGATVAILTNGTSTIPEEMDELGVTEHVDAIFNSAEIGYAKPDIRAFQAVCDGLSVDPASVFFTDDSPSKLAGAIKIGMTTEHFTSVDNLRSSLTELGLL